MTPQVSPTEQLRAEVDDLFGDSEEQRDLGDALEALTLALIDGDYQDPTATVDCSHD